MESQAQHLAWGIGFAGMMYVVGNGVWTNHLARQKQWMGWLMWLLTSLVILVAGAFVDTRLAASQADLWQRMSSVDMENHWIVLTLYALMSVPGAAAVILKQASTWTRLALLIPALIVFVPAGLQLGTGANGIAAGLGLALAIAALMFAWQFMLDTPPEEKQRKAA
ncbi:MAG: hypothetical protein Q9M23_05720 [Mariprofundaceae bacterium]|nr:hypothetical protein [Mariprofundaceae bacterium]